MKKFLDLIYFLLLELIRKIKTTKPFDFCGGLEDLRENMDVLKTVENIIFHGNLSEIGKGGENELNNLFWINYAIVPFHGHLMSLKYVAKEFILFTKSRKVVRNKLITLDDQIKHQLKIYIYLFNRIIVSIKTCIKILSKINHLKEPYLFHLHLEMNIHLFATFGVYPTKRTHERQSKESHSTEYIYFEVYQSAKALKKFCKKTEKHTMKKFLDGWKMVYIKYIGEKRAEIKYEGQVAAIKNITPPNEDIIKLVEDWEKLDEEQKTHSLYRAYYEERY